MPLSDEERRARNRSRARARYRETHELLTPEQRRARAQLAAHRRHYGDQAVLPDEAATLQRAVLLRRLDKAVDGAALLPLRDRASRAARLLAVGEAS